MTLTRDGVWNMLRYDTETGAFTWVVSPRPNVRAGSIAGMINSQGYRVIKVRSLGFMAHRLAWFFVNGAWPTDEIDHINGCRDDNRIANLREATRADNNRNVSIRCDNTSGRKGVTWHKRQRRWYAQIQIAGKKTYLGSYKDIQAAAEAYRAAEVRLFGQFARGAA